MQSITILQQIIVWALPILFAVTVHEVSHGFIAYKLGDKTAYVMGRLTLNPLKHIDLVGTVIVPIVLLMIGGFIFGWAKPVPINEHNLHNPRRDMAFVAAAGPLANLVMALLWAAIAKLALIANSYHVSGAMIMALMGEAGIAINLILMVLNLIPIPPLDGSRILASFLSPRAAFKFNKLEPYGFFILLGLLAFGLLSWLLAPPFYFLRSLIYSLFGI